MITTLVFGVAFSAGPSAADHGPTHSISGTVTSGAVGLNAVTVELSSGGLTLGTTTTAMDGTYAFADLLPGTYTVTPSKTNYTMAPTSQEIILGAADAGGVDFAATLNTHTISGQVSGAANVLVTLSGDSSGTDTTDGSGNYSFPNLAAGGSYTVTPSKDNHTFAPPSATVNALSQNETRNFTATLNTHTISGQVTGAAGVLVTLSGGASGTDTIDGSGNYSFPNLAAGGTYTVTPSKANYSFSPTSSTVSNLSQNETRDFTATLNQHSISGTITKGGNPLPGVTVTLSGGASASATTNASGQYSFSSLDAGASYTVTPSLANHSFTPPGSTIPSLSANETRNFTATLNTHTISGQVTGAAGVLVTLSGGASGTDTTDGSGNYSFANLPAGATYTVTPSKANYSFSPPSSTISGLSQNETRNFTATLNQHSISGTITKGGNPLQGVTVSLSGGDTSATTTNASGQYSFSSLDAGLSYTVTPSLANHSFSPPSSTIPSLSQNETRDFTATVNQHSISGTITKGGNPLPGVTVTLSGGASASATSNASGQYSFTSLDAGASYTVTPSLANHSFTPPSSTIPTLSQNEARNFTAAVNQHSISGQVTLGASGLGGVTMTLSGTESATTTTDSAGNYTFSSVDAGGNYTVTPSKANHIFAPGNRQYANLAANQAGQNFTATLVRLSVGDLVVAEGAGNAAFTVSLSDQSGNPVASDKNVTFNYSTANGSAFAGQDYTARTNQPASVPAGQTSATFQVPVPIIDDAQDEGDETFAVSLNSVVNAEVLDGQAQGTITDNDPEPALSISNVSLNEGQTGPTTFLFTVTLTPASGKTATVNFSTQAGSGPTGAVSGGVAPQDDYQHTSGTLTFDPGQTTKTIAVIVNGDTFNEANETFNINLSAPSNATLPPGAGTGTILNDDAQASLSVNDQTVGEGGGNATFTVTLSPASGQTVTVNYSTLDGPSPAATFMNPADYTSTSNLLSFAPTETSKTITVPIVQDALDEPDEKFTVRLSTESNATVAKRDGIGTIADDDPPPTVSIANAAPVGEGNPSVFTVSLSAPSGHQVTVQYATANGTAIAPADYTAAPATTLTFAPGETTKQISVPTINDALDEPPSETFTVALSAPTNVTLGAPSSATGTINDNDDPPSLSISDATALEGNGEKLGTCGAAPGPGQTPTGFAVFTVTLSAASGQAVTVQWATANNTAIAPDDYSSVPATTLTFSPGGALSQTVCVRIFGDLSDEPNETFNVVLSNLTNATPAKGTGVGTILDDDGEPALSVTGASDSEGGGVATFVVSRLPTAGNTATVDLTTVGGTATPGSDYASIPSVVSPGPPITCSANPCTLTLAPGQSSKAIDISLVNDTLDEDDETFTVRLSNEVGAKVLNGGDRIGFVTILDDDAPPSVSIGDATVTEGNAGTVNASFEVTLSTASGRTLSVDYAASNGSAVSPDDYAPLSGTVSFAPGETSKTVVVPVNGDTSFEADESFAIGLSSPVNVTIADGEGVGSIVNDDSPAPPPPPPPPPPQPPGGGTTTSTTTTGTGPGATTSTTTRPPTPGPRAPQTFTGMGISGAPVRLLDNFAAIGVTCSKKAKGNCVGSIKVQRRTLALAIVHGQPTAGAVTLGRESFAIPRGRTEKVLVTLSRRAVKAVKRSGRLWVTVVVTARDSAGKRAKPTTRSLWLQAPKKLKILKSPKSP